MIDNYEDAPSFVDGIAFSSLSGDTLKTNAVFLDAITQQPIKVFTHGIYAEAQWYLTRNPTTGEMPRVWTGAFQYRTGMTQAVFDVSGSGITNQRIRIYHKLALDTSEGYGTLDYDQVWPTAQTRIDVDITSKGFVDGDVVLSTIVAHYPTAPYTKTSVFQVRDAFVHPLETYPTVSGMWNGVPNFTGTSIPASGLNQLSNAQDWCMERVSLVPRIPFVGSMYQNGTHKSNKPFPSNPYPLYIGWMKKANNQNTMRAEIDYYAYNGTEYVKIYVNDVLKYTSPALHNGDYGTLDIAFDVSDLGNGFSYLVRIDNEVAAGQGQEELKLYGGTVINSRFTIRRLEVTNVRGYATPPTGFGILESTTYATWRSRLNAISNVTNTAYNRINNAPQVFDRAHMMRRKVGVDDHQNSSMEWMSLPFNTRLGERYVVAGRDVKICWGGFNLTASLTSDPTNRHPYEFANEVALIGSDKVDVREGYFDEFDGLFVGSTYYIIGKDLMYFAEYLR